MATGKITKRAVDSVQAAENDVYLWDTDLKGFGLKVTPKARRVYLVKYRGGGRTRRVTIGVHGSPWTPEQARQEAKRLLGQVAARRDTPQEVNNTKQELTVGQLCDLYMAEGVRTQKQSNIKTDRGRIERHIKPLLGRRPIGSVTRGDAQKFLQDIADGKTAMTERTGFRGRAVVKGGEGAANRTLALLGGVYSFAIGRGLLNDNPVKGVRRFKSKRVDCWLSSEQLAKLGDVLKAAEKEGTNPSANAAIRLLTLTGCRKMEILTLKWEYINWVGSFLALPDSKTGQKVVPIGAAALALLRTLPKEGDNPYVLPGLTPGSHFVGLQKVWERLRVKADLGHVRLHDLRHSFASIGVSSGDSLFVVGKLLGHHSAATTERYAHLSNDPLRAAADSISGKIAADMGLTNAPDAEVVPIRTAKR